MRVVWSLLGLLAVVVIGAFFYASTLIDKAVETGGSKLLGVPVTLGMAKLEPFSGELWLKELVVSNPEGYKTPEAFSLGEVYVKLDISSLFENAVVVNKILVQAPNATFEGDYAQNNFNQLYKNLQKNTASSASSNHVNETAEEHASHTHHESKKVIIDEFVLEGAMLKAVLNTPVGQKSIDKKLPDLRLTDVGRNKGGVSMAEAAKELVTPVQQEIQRVAHGAMDELKGVLKNGVDTLKSRVKSLTDDVKSLF